MKSHVLVLPNMGHAPILARLVEMGDLYGLDFQLMHDKPDAMVEFYDMRYPHTIFGQFVSRYFMDTLISSNNSALCLDGGVTDWSLTAKSFTAVRKWIDDLIVDEVLI